jgi:hypothetical protein
MKGRRERFEDETYFRGMQGNYPGPRSEAWGGEDYGETPRFGHGHAPSGREPRRQIARPGAGPRRQLQPRPVLPAEREAALSKGPLQPEEHEAGRWALVEGARPVSWSARPPARPGWNYELGNYGRSSSPEHYGLREPAEEASRRRVGFAGVGPKGWRRPDDRVLDEIVEGMVREPDLDAGEIEVAVDLGDVTLRGVVGDLGEKYLAEEIASGVAGVRDVENRIRVRGRRAD